MRNLKKLLALVLAFMMTMSLMVTVNAAGYEGDYADQDKIAGEYEEAIDFLRGLGVFKGYEDNSFKPEDKITRAEVCAIVYRVLTGDVTDSQAKIYADYPNPFTDVLKGAWYEGYVNFCANGEYIKGDPEGTFRPNADITGYEVLAIVLRALGYGQKGEFEGSAWMTQTATTANRLGITENVRAEDILSGKATRQTVAEILYQTIQTPTVSYTYTYEKDVLVADTDTNRTYYRAYLSNTNNDLPIYDNLLHRTFKIVGADITGNGRDNYGRPIINWVKDNAGDQISDGTKYVVNRSIMLTDAAGNPVDLAGNPIDTSVAGWQGVWVGNSKGLSDTIAFTQIPRALAEYHDVITECQLATDVNDNESIDGADVIEYLNGALVTPRTGYTLDATHTTNVAAGVYTLNAPGRTMEVYYVDGYSIDGGVTETPWIFVYYDTLMGTVTSIVPHTEDTAGHLMDDSELHIQVNGTANDVIYLGGDADFDEDYTVGQVVLFNTWGGRDTDRADMRWQDIQKIVPQRVDDFQAPVRGNLVWAINLRNEEPVTETFTANATTGASAIKAGLMAADKTEYTGNVVYLANQTDFNFNPANPSATPNSYRSNGYFVGRSQDTSGAAAEVRFASQTTVPAGYREQMRDEQIGQTLTAVRDQNGFVVGLSKEGSSEDVGVVVAMDTTKAGVGSYALEVQLLLMDGTYKTITLLDANKQPYAISTDPMTYAARDNMGIGRNVLVQVKPYSLSGQTFYEVVATHSGAGTAFNVAETGKLGDTTAVQTGVADTLWPGTSTYKTYTTGVNREYINKNTKFIVAETHYQYNLGGGINQGGRSSWTFQTYTDFRSIPTITGRPNEILFQKIGNNVYIYPNETDGTDLSTADYSNTSASQYRLMGQAGYADDDSYLILGNGPTYADHSDYKALKNGEETTLSVVGNNTGLNAAIDAAMEDGYLVVVTGWSASRYATAVAVLDGTTASDNTFTNMGGTQAQRESTNRTIAVSEDVNFAQDGVLYNATTANLMGAAATNYLTIADDCKVIIVNLSEHNYKEGTFASIMQYEKYITNGSVITDTDDDGLDDTTGLAAKDTAPNGHAFVYELNNLGYVSVIYIID